MSTLVVLHQANFVLYQHACGKHWTHITNHFQCEEYFKYEIILLFESGPHFDACKALALTSTRVEQRNVFMLKAFLCGIYNMDMVQILQMIHVNVYFKHNKKTVETGLKRTRTRHQVMKQKAKKVLIVPNPALS